MTKGIHTFQMGDGQCKSLLQHQVAGAQKLMDLIKSVIL